MMALEKEREYFEGHKKTLLEKYKGQFVLIGDGQFVGAYPSMEDAYLAGLEKFGVEPFLVRQVLEAEPVGFAPMMSVTPHASV